MKILIKLLPFLFSEMSLEERINEFCEKNNKSKYYGDKLDHKKLDELQIKKYKLKL